MTDFIYAKKLRYLVYKSLYFKKQVFTMLTIDAQISRLKRCVNFYGKIQEPYNAFT